MQSTTVGGCRHADARGLEQRGSISLRAVVRVKLDETKHLVVFLKIVILQMGCLQDRWRRVTKNISNSIPADDEETQPVAPVAQRYLVTL